MINPNDVHYEYSIRGYMVYYKNKPIYSAWIDKSAKGCISNLKLFREQAELAKRQIINGFVDQHTRERIETIDREEAKDDN